MKDIKYNISTYFSMFLANVKSMLEYRTDFIVGIISQICTQILELIFLWIVFQNTDTLNGWNYYQLLLLYGIMMLSVSIENFFFDEIFEIGPMYIRDGKFDTILLRPIHPLVSIVSNSKEVSAIGYALIGFVLIISMLIKLQISITILLVLKILFFAIMGASILGAILVLFSVSSFWTFRSNEIMWSAYRIYTFAEYPIDIYNKFIRVLITVIFPFVFVAYYPTINYLNMEGNYLVYLSPVIVLVLWIVAVRIWNLGLKKYRSTGN